jgi:hypothetical protein
MARSVGKRTIKRSPIAAPPLFDHEINLGGNDGLANGVDSALTNERRGQRVGRLLEHDKQRHAEHVVERQVGAVPLVGDTAGPQHELEAINAKAVAEHRRITGGGGVV